MEFCTLNKNIIKLRLKSVQTMTDMYIKSRDIYFRNSAINIITNTLYDFEVCDITDFTNTEVKLMKHGLVYMKIMVTFGTDIGMFYVILKNLMLHASDSKDTKHQELVELEQLLKEL